MQGGQAAAGVDCSQEPRRWEPLTKLFLFQCCTGVSGCLHLQAVGARLHKVLQKSLTALATHLLVPQTAPACISEKASILCPCLRTLRGQAGTKLQLLPDVHSLLSP